MSNGGAIGEWEENYRAPDRVTLVAWPRVTTALFGGVVGAVFSNLVFKTTTFDAWPSALVGAVVGAAIAVIVWLAKWDRLELDPKGFTEISFGRRGQHIPWSDCTMFVQGEPQRRRWYYVGFSRYSDGYVVPGETVLSLNSTYGLPLDQLVNLMNAFRTRAAGVDV